MKILKKVDINAFVQSKEKVVSADVLTRLKTDLNSMEISKVPITEKILERLFDNAVRVVDIQNIVDLDLNDSDDLIP